MTIQGAKKWGRVRRLGEETLPHPEREKGEVQRTREGEEGITG